MGNKRIKQISFAIKNSYTVKDSRQHRLFIYNFVVAVG